jgi:hypothetical protein
MVLLSTARLARDWWRLTIVRSRLTKKNCHLYLCNTQLICCVFCLQIWGERNFCERRIFVRTAHYWYSQTWQWNIHLHCQKSVWKSRAHCPSPGSRYESQNIVHAKNTFTSVMYHMCYSLTYLLWNFSFRVWAALNIGRFETFWQTLQLPSSG